MTRVGNAAVRASRRAQGRSSLGEHTDQILAEAGYGPDEIAALRQDEIV